MKEYIGDGVYIDTDGCGGIILTTENGISIENTIYLERGLLNKIINYEKRVHGLDDEKEPRP